MTPLETQLAQLLREWQREESCECAAIARYLQYREGLHPVCLWCRTRDALALYDRMAQEISQERDPASLGASER